jgi:hypothetical protein
MAKLIVVLADLQVPYHDPRYIKVMLKFARAMRKSKAFDQVEVGQIGDLTDQPETGRWNKGAAGEYAGTFWANIRTTRKIIQEFEFDWIKDGNHDRRVEDYLERYCPALGGPESEINMESLFRIGKGTPTRLERKPFYMAPGWIAGHGDEGTINSVAGRTAFALAQRWDDSVMCGHTHRAGTVSVTVGLPGRRRRITGMEIGHGMLEKHATYIKSGSPNWQRAFGLLVVEGRKTTDQLVMMNPDSSFSWDGRIWRA